MSWYSPDLSEKYAMRVPSGDQTGSRSWTPTLSQIPDVPLFRRYRHDVAAELERGARAGRRKRGVTDPFRAADEPEPRFAQIRRDGERQLFRLAVCRVEQVKISGLLVDDMAAA